jgi:hypothetical protein
MDNIPNLADELLKELDESVIQNMDEEELIKLSKEINPYGRTIEGKHHYLNMSYTNLSESYIRKITITALVGFLNRLCDEWRVPDNVGVIPVYDYVKDPTLADPKSDIKYSDSKLKEMKFNKKWMEKRIVVKQFLEEVFQFDPDIHVRSSYKPNFKDKNRTVLYTPPAQLAIWNLHKEAKESKNRFVKEENMDIVNEYRKKPRPWPEANECKFNEVEAAVYNMIPPQDIFAKFSVYYNNNFETLRECVRNLYGAYPDLELAINPYSWHETEEQSEKFKKKHGKEVITDILTLTSGKWNIIGPFKECNEKISFFNEHTTVLEEMLKQLESDSKIGQELLKKKVKVKKVKNILENGQDNEGLDFYKKHFGEVHGSVGKLDPKKEIYDYRVLNEPDNAVDVPVFRISEGGNKIERDLFYTEEGLPDSLES